MSAHAKPEERPVIDGAVAAGSHVKKTVPSKTLYQGKPYTSAAATDLRAVFRRIQTKLDAEAWAKKEGLPI